MINNEYDLMLIKYAPDNIFTVHQEQSHLDDNCKSVMCAQCSSDKFFVGKGFYYTAISCENCGWQLCVHDG